MSRLLRGLAVAISAGLLSSGLPAPAPAVDGHWTTSVFATVPEPAEKGRGGPAYVFAHRNGKVYAGSYQDPNGAGVPSRVFEWSADGTPLRSWPVPGQDLAAEHGVQVANQTRNGRLVVLETSTSTVRTLSLRSGRWRTIATLPGATPNYATWGPGGALYVTDYAQGVLWKVSPRGVARPWFRSTALEGMAGFGTTGIAFRRATRDLLITQQTSPDTPTQGHLYRLPIQHGGSPGTLQTLWTSQPGDLPDGFGIGRSGHVYVALAGLAAQLVELTATGAEVDRFPELPLTGDNGSEVPFDTPCSATFLGTRVLVANQSAVAGDASHQAILAVDVGETGLTPYLPRRARLHH
jgi:sugar lactone lactonase YvrE